jgi:selenocysteine lyase/cysteine desulfurase
MDSKNVGGSYVPDRSWTASTTFSGSRAATISFTLDEMLARDGLKRLVAKQIAVRNGNFYAVRCLEALNIQDTQEVAIRISLVHYNSSEDVDRLVEGFREL